MTAVSFALKPIINMVISKITGNFFDKYKIKRKLKKISIFSREFDNSLIDTYSFQKFLDEETTTNLIFNYVFSAKFSITSREDFILNLSQMANEFIDHMNLERGAPKYEVKKILIEYFECLILKLEDFRLKELNDAQNVLIASIQSSIIDSNQDIKIFIENKLIELKNLTLAKALTDDKLTELLERSIMSLGNRYTELANVTTKSSQFFESLIFNNEIGEFLNLKNQILINETKDILIEFRKKEYENKLEQLDSLNTNLSSLEKYNFQNKENYKSENLNEYLKYQQNISDSLSNIKYLLYDLKKRDYHYEKVINRIYDIEKLISEIYNYTQELGSEIINQPYLVIKGDGGIGKSHLLADHAKKLQKKGHIIFLFLGQHFSSKEHPFKQIFEFIEYKGNSDDFLFEINNRAKKSKKNAVILIDALNEGQGKYFWKEYIIDFLMKIKKYPHISLVMSNRTNYMKTVFPEDFFKKHQVTLVEHKGFTSLTLDHLHPFLEYFKINPAVVPQLQSECMNPLFLKMYCEVAKGQTNSFNGWSITTVLSKYVEQVNEKLANDERFSFVGKINVVNKCLNQISKQMIDNGNFSLNIEDAYKVISNIAKEYMHSYQEFINGLIEENLLASSTDYNGNEIIYFSYERFGDLYIANEIINTQLDSDNKLNSTLLNQYHLGIYEALSITLPEKLEIEIFEVFKEPTISYEVIEAFVKGLSWRMPNSITDKIIPILNWCIEADDEIRYIVFEQLIKFSYLENNVLNSDYLHDYLFNKSLADRDSKWTTFINQRPDIINRLIYLITNNKIEVFNKKTVQLLAISVTWLFTSSHRILRDKATHALGKLFYNNMNLILPTLIKFRGVNDPYVYERLFAAIYGATLRSKNHEYLKEISEYIAHEIFEKEEVYPHILLRDYARGILLYAKKVGEFERYDLNWLAPPYKSKWYENIPTIEDIDKFKIIYSQDKYKKKSYSVQAIINSMTTEYGRGTGGYGDFGRYVFQSAIRKWENQFEPQDLSNIATKRVFDMGYDIETHGEYDNMNGQYFDRHSNTLERIGKKYQWIAFHELLARLTDNFPIYKEKNYYSEEYNRYLEKKSEDFMEFIRDYNDSEFKDEMVGSEFEDEMVASDVLNPEDHIIDVKRTIIPFNRRLIQSIRDIDCTLQIDKKVERDKSLVSFKLPEQASKEWTQTDFEIKNVENLYEIMYESERFVSLAHLYINKRNKGENYSKRDEFFVKTKAVFVKKDYAEYFIKNRIKEGARYGVEWRQSYELFAYEYFWHPSFEDINKEFNLENEETYKIDAIWSYLWERNFDYSTDEDCSISYLMPCAELVNSFKLEQDQEGIWKNSNGKIIAFDGSLLGYETCLLFNKEYLECFLEENDYKLFWDAYFEKVSDNNFHEWRMLYMNENGDFRHKIINEKHGELKNY